MPLNETKKRIAEAHPETTDTRRHPDDDRPLKRLRLVRRVHPRRSRHMKFVSGAAEKVQGLVTDVILKASRKCCHRDEMAKATEHCCCGRGLAGTVTDRCRRSPCRDVAHSFAMLGLFKTS